MGVVFIFLKFNEGRSINAKRLAASTQQHADNSQGSSIRVRWCGVAVGQCTFGGAGSLSRAANPQPNLSLFEPCNELPDAHAKRTQAPALIVLLIIAICPLLCAGESFTDRADCGKAGQDGIPHDLQKAQLARPLAQWARVYRAPAGCSTPRC
jgi:hypothetical protein